MAANSESGSLLEALFAEPCDLCVAVANGSQGERKDPKSAANAKVDCLGLDTPPAIAVFPPGTA